MKSTVVGYLFDVFVVACMTTLVVLGKCEMKDFFIVVSPIVAVRAWQLRNGGPPPGVAGSAFLFMMLPFVALLLDRKAVT